MKCVCVVRKWGRVLREFFFESLEQINGKGDAHLVRPVKPLQLLQTLLSPAEWRTGRSALEINNLDFLEGDGRDPGVSASGSLG